MLERLLGLFERWIIVQEKRAENQIRLDEHYLSRAGETGTVTRVSDSVPVDEDMGNGPMEKDAPSAPEVKTPTHEEVTEKVSKAKSKKKTKKAKPEGPAAKEKATEEFTGAEVRKYVRLWMDKVEDDGTQAIEMLKDKTGFESMIEIEKQPNAQELFEAIVRQCVLDGVSLKGGV